jgi:tetratricopeptide (TPR) repeat protein
MDLFEESLDGDADAKPGFSSVTDGSSNTMMIGEKFVDPKNPYGKPVLSSIDNKKPDQHQGPSGQEQAKEGKGWEPPEISNKPWDREEQTMLLKEAEGRVRIEEKRVDPKRGAKGDGKESEMAPGKFFGSGASASTGNQVSGPNSYKGQSPGMTGGGPGGAMGPRAAGGFGGRSGPMARPSVGPLNNGSLQPGFVFGFQPQPNRLFGNSSGGGKSFGGGGSFSGGLQGGSGGTIVGGGRIMPGVTQLPHITSYLGGQGGDNISDLLVKVQEARTGSLLFGVGVNGDAAGTLEERVAKKWRSLSDAERVKALNDLRRELPPRYKEIVTTYFNNLGQSEAGKAPLVWYRDRQRPSFARVYVGGGNSLELVSLQVSVTVEGPRARTIVDHIFHNPHDRQLEGTFEYPLPTGASASYFAMFLGQTRGTLPPRFGRGGQAPPLPAEALASSSPETLVRQVSTADWGQLQEARVVSREKALETYEDIVRVRIDPALLEYAGGNTFSARVFPIPAKGYNRVIIAYEELLPMVGDRAVYRFPLPDCKLNEVQFTLQANEGEFKQASFLPKEAKKTEGGGRVVYSRTWKDKGPGGEALFALTPKNSRLQAISGRQGESGPLYLYARVRPNLKTEAARPFADHAVFLLDTSLSEHPDRFSISMKLWQKILENDPAIKKFNILAFDVGTSWIEPKGWLDNTKEGRTKALSRLDSIVLEGATDLSAALEKLCGPLAGLARQAPLNVFLLSDAQITWGEADVNSLVSKFDQRCPYSTRFHCYRFGLGADNLELFEGLTRKGGGIFNCFSESDLAAAARAHKNHCLQVERVRFQGGPAMSDVLIAGRKAAVYPGGELIVTGRAHDTGRSKIIVEGTFLGERIVQEFPVEIGRGDELAARGWGEVAVASLLAVNDSKLDSLVTAYCQQFGIGSRVASFLVLENPADYKRLNLEEERGKVVPGGDLEKFLDDSWRNFTKAIRPKEAFEEFLNKVGPGAKPTSGGNMENVAKLLRKLTDKDFEIPQGKTGGAVIHAKEVPPGYLAAREADLGNVHAYLDEAKRRANAKDPDGAIRVLSGVVELFPTRADALRLVGYRLLDVQQPEQAIRLFQQVERNRPFEPHSYRDLARSLEESGRYALAGLQYEILLTGQWHNRFRDSLKEVAVEEYARMMQDALRKKAVSREVAEFFGERLESMASLRQQADLRVTISWNTDATDVDLWVIEPDGTKCFYSHNRTKNGGELSQDQTQGYGPERYQVQTAIPGVYTVIVHYFAANANLLGGETHVNVIVAKHAGTPEEQVERHTVILRQANEQVEVCKVKVR